MNARSGTERILDAYLAPEADRLADRVIDAALDEIARSPQRRAVRVPWRFPTMPALSRATGIAAVALVAVVGAAGLVSLTSKPSGGGVSQATATPPPPTATPTAEPTVAPTPRPSEVAPGIFGWKTYTSAVYGYTISYPEHWVIDARATEKWQPGASEDGPWVDAFIDPETPDGESIALFALQFPAPAGADLATWDGLLAALTEMCTKPAEYYFNRDGGRCPSGSVAQASTRMCLGSAGCLPVALVYNNDLPRALWGDPEKGTFTYLLVARVDDFPSAARYDGTVKLLKSILSQLGVREPRPEETPN